MIARNLLFGISFLLFPVVSARAADRDRIEASDFTKTVTIAFNGGTATVTNSAGVAISYGSSSAAIAITSTVEGVEYVLSGSSASGYVQITSTYASKVTLNGVILTSPDGPALSVLSEARSFIVTTEGSSNVLTDSATYARSGSGALYASGPLIFSGKGSVSVAGMKSHAICSATYVRALGGDVKVSVAVKDAVHASSFFRMDQGSFSLSASGDGIDTGSGYVLINGGSISIRSTVDDTKGIACDGALTVNGGAVSMTVDGVQSKGMSSKGAMTINGGTLSFNLAGSVFLETVTGTSGSYVDPSYCTAIKSDGNITIGGGNILITHTGTAGKGVSSDGNITIGGGSLDLFMSGGSSASYTSELGVADAATADCLKADGTLSITSGSIIARSTGAGGDCLSSDLALAVSGGSLDLTTEGISGDCLSTKLTLGVSGGLIKVSAKGAQSKGFKSNSDITIGGGTMSFAMSGAVVLEAVTASRYDPSYCTAIKSDANITITDGAVTITHSGQAGKGVSADGNVVISGGTLGITTSGANSSSFTNASGTLDMAAADCLKADGNLTITGGTITAASTGNAADAISCDGVATLGVLGNDSTPVITASTTGAKVLLSGSGNSADYVNAKAFKAGGNLNMNGGIFRATTQQDGGEGMESKANLTIAGGLVEITSYDDCINATTKVTISGGTVYCYSTGNDGIDSNGTFLISGGLIISSGSNAPEEGFDCDQNNFAITGGVMIGTGGATSTPTAASSTQRSVIYKGAGTANVILQVKSSTASNLVYKIPRTYSGGGGGGGGSSTPMTMLFSNAGLSSGTSYSIISGATVTGGTEFHGYYTGATVTGGTTLKTFTPTSMVTTVQ